MQNTVRNTDSSVWKNTDAFHRPVYNAPREKQLTLEKPYILYWTPHATDRAEYREGSGSIVLSAFLEDICIISPLTHDKPFIKYKV